MESIPVVTSTLSPIGLGLFLQGKYKLSQKTACTLLKTGINHTYLVNDGGNKYVFRVYSLNWRTQQEILEEIKLLNLLHHNHIPVSVPVMDARGSYLLELNAPEGNRFGVMFSFAQGEKLLNFSADLHYKVGEAMARMHQVTHNLQLQRVVYTPQVLLVDSFKQLEKFLPINTDEYKWMASAQKYLLNEVENVNNLRLGAVHMDVWFDNFNISKDGSLTLFDFDFCGNGWLSYDIAYYILQLHSTEKVEVERNSKQESFLKGYESVSPISAEEKRILPVFGVCMCFFYLGVQCQRFNNWSNVFLNETYLKRFINVLVKKYFEDNVTKNLPLFH